MSEKPHVSKRRQVGNYVLQEKLGQGGMSVVFKASDLRTNETVAIKIASRAVINDPHLSRRFELEFALAHPFAHRNLVKVLENGKHEGTPFLVMEYVDGPSLARHIAEHKGVREHEALSILLPIADALTYLHEHRTIHRDIKPANILMTAKGEVKLCDLGLVKNLASTSALTRTNMGLGTMHFAAPEQFDDAGSADERSDVYALAATFYTTLTGEHPFGKGTMMSILQRKLTNQFDAPMQKLPQLRPAVDAAIRMALHAEPQQRPASISNFVAYLTGWKKYAPNVQLPGNVANVKPLGRVAKKSTHERRVNARYEIEVAGSCRAIAGGTTQRWEAMVTDISTTGICLQISRRFEPGSVLEIALSVNPDNSALTQLVRVRWCKATETNTWLLGCEFVHAMTEEDLEGMFTELMGRTEMH